MTELEQDAPIFIIGSARSGTSLLRLMLTSHPEICITPESVFWLKLRKKYSIFPDLVFQIDSFLEDLFQQEKFKKQWRLDREHLRANLKQRAPLNYPAAISTVDRTYLETFFPNARIWGDKNPSYLSHVDTILEDFPNAKFIHIIRDIRSIYASIAAIYSDESSRVYWSKLDSPLSFATRQWRRAYEVFESKTNNPQVHILFYERLVSDPVNTLKPLCSWLGVSFYERMLEFHQLNREKQLVTTFALKWEQKTLEAYRSDSCG